MFADIIVDISVESLDKTYQYLVPNRLESEIHIGTPVQVPFGRGNRLLKGFVIHLTEEAAFDVTRMKEIVSVATEQMPVESELLQVAGFIRERYGSTMNEAIKTVIPIRKKVKSVEEHWLTFAVEKNQVRDILAEYKRRHYAAKVRLIEGMIAENEVISKRMAIQKYKANKAVIDGLVKEGVIRVSRERIYRKAVGETVEGRQTPPVLNEEQQQIVDDFVKDYREGIRQTYLLYGITGSGKTEVYMQLLEEVLTEGKQAIVLIPEIALTFQTVSRFQKRFPGRVSILHSRLSEGERADQIEMAKNGDIDIMIGPRSALFTPFERLGIIIIDEEHETSYISESSPRYHTDEVARFRAKLAGASVVLGSATPSVKSYQKAKEGHYKEYRLTRRAGNAALPDINVVDLREELKAKNRSVFSRLLQQKLQDCLARGEQAMLFINRRGYAGFVSCRNCGNVIQCSHCDVSMTAHKNHVGDVDTLVCHYCGHSVKMPERCPECGSPYIATFGLGTQKVEEMLQYLLPQARILRMDADTTTGKYGHEGVLSSFREGKADILIGTQMIVKGHDFPNVTLVAALAADMSMFEQDYRSSERTFQLLQQASGRAGRGKKPGEVIIQTYKPEHYVIESIRKQEDAIFYENELAYRRMLGYPPCKALLRVMISSEQKEECEEILLKIAKWIQAAYADEVQLLGPTAGGLRKRKDRFHWQLLIKGAEEEVLLGIKEKITAWMEKIPHSCYLQYELEG
ncbi:MAG: primosomal protein N' [Eubacterium sp.]